jgi:tetratricopeptide (TPR) repeat protein
MSRAGAISPARRKRAEQRFAEAVAHQRAGNLAAAEQCLRQVVQSDSAHAGALHSLALLVHRRGELDQAVELMQRAARGRGVDASLLNNLGNMLRESGRAEEAMGAYRNAVALDAGNLNAHFNLAQLALAAGEAGAARAGFERVLAAAPDDVAALNGLALADLASGDAASAVARFQRATALAPEDAGIQADLAQALLAADRAEQSLEEGRRASERFPSDARVLRALAAAQSTLELYEDAEVTLRRILDLVPGDREARAELARALAKQLREDDAIEECEQLIARFPGHPEGHATLGIALQQLGRLDEAVAAFERALAIDAHDVASWNNLGMTHLDLGNREQATDAFATALSVDPDLPEALFNVIRTRRNEPGQLAELERVEALADSGRCSVAERVSLHFALGKAFDDLAQYDRAFRHYDLGNALKRRSVRFIPEKFRQWAQCIHDTFDERFFERTRGFGSASRRPVFIVGTPRSGTSLVEQILASHPQVFGADELRILGQLADGLPQRLKIGGEYPRAAASLDAAAARGMAQDYLAHLAELDPDSPLVTDKMPTNYFHLGLIAALFPRAHVIHCVRDPMDACFSNYIQLFGDAHYYSYSLEHIAVYYREYVRLMAHWRTVVPLAIHDVSYEALVEDPESVTRGMLSHLELPWDDACLEFHRTRRAVRTASHWQVRQPIYRSARQRWRRYEKHLEGLAADIAYPQPVAS